MGKVKTIQNWFKRHVKDNGSPFCLDKNQAKIVVDTHKNTIVTARAGSGKTRTIIAKIVYLLAQKNYAPSEIIVFAFNKKACTEINTRLTKITVNGQPLFITLPKIATTFHAFSYQLLGGSKDLKNRLIVSDETDMRFQESPSQFITRAEQQFFQNYQALEDKINSLKNEVLKSQLSSEYQNLKIYHRKLQASNQINFNQLIAEAAQKLQLASHTPYRYILIDEYQDFSLLFLTLVKALRKTCPSAYLLVVGDDWQAINRFAGSNVDYFINFQKYFSENSTKLFIPTNYRSGKIIVKNANYFMSKALGDFSGCKAKNHQKSKIFYRKVENYQQSVQNIINQYSHKSIKILSRNNDLRYHHLPLEKFVKSLAPHSNELSFSTIHRSKGLEADIIILLEIDPEKFPGSDKTDGKFAIFGDTKETLLADEMRLFYVALTRAKETLYLLSKNPKITKKNQKYNFFSYLNPDFLNPLF